MQDLITEALKSQNAQYIEIRMEESEGTTVRYRGKDLEEASRRSGLGGNVRALAGGGWGFAAFTDISTLKQQVSTAVTHARRVGGASISLAESEPNVDIVIPSWIKDPRKITLKDKKHVLDQYGEIMLRVPGVKTCTINYTDRSRKTYYANSEGSYIEQERSDINLGMTAVAVDGMEVQQATVSEGSLGDFSFVESMHEQAEKLGWRSVQLLSASQVKGGEFTVVLDPVLAGVFIHEAFGHLSEADHIYEDEHLRAVMQLGRRFGGKHLNVIDGASIPGLRGSYKYDDEGTLGTQTQLIHEGELVGRLHSRETAAKMGESATGNARAINYAYPPIVRMTNTFIEPGNTTFQEMISDIKEGIYAVNWYGGMTSMEMFTFSAGEAYRIRNGKVQELLRPIMLTGNLFTTLEHLVMVGDDLLMNQGGGCGKGGQSPLPVSNGSPHIRIEECLVGGG